MSVLFRNVTKADHVRQGLMDTLPKLVAVYGAAAASLGADWYDELRQQAEVKGKFQAIVADLPDIGRTDALAGWAVGPLFGANPDALAALSMASGGLQRIIFNADRETISQSSVQDRSARGWSREGFGECGFCAMLIGRGGVYTEATADFASHDNCKCVAVPAWGGEPNPVKAYTPTNRNITDNDRARVREYLRSNSSAPRSNFSATREKTTAALRTTGAQSAERLSSINLQLKTYDTVLANGGGTAWTRSRVVELRKELAAFKGH